MSDVQPYVWCVEETQARSAGRGRRGSWFWESDLGDLHGTWFVPSSSIYFWVTVLIRFLRVRWCGVMNLAFKFLLSPQTTRAVNQHRMHFFIHRGSPNYRRPDGSHVTPRPQTRSTRTSGISSTHSLGDLMSSPRSSSTPWSA